MVEMKNANVPGGSAAAPEQGVRDMDERLGRTEERERREDRGCADADGVDQLLQAVREILPPLPALGLRVAAQAAAGEGGTAKVAAQAAQLADVDGMERHGVEDGANRLSQGAATTGARSGAADVASIPAARASDAISPAQSMSPVALAGDDAGQQGAAPPAAPGTAAAAAGETATQRKPRAAGGEEPQPLAPGGEARRPAEAAHAVERPAPQSAPQPRTEPAAPASEPGWVYQFRSWGEQHAVRVSPAAHPGQQQPASAALALHPSSALVEQRLNAHGESAGGSGHWVLREHGEQGRQGQRDQDARRQPEEDES